MSVDESAKENVRVSQTGENQPNSVNRQGQPLKICEASKSSRSRVGIPPVPSVGKSVPPLRLEMKSKFISAKPPKHFVSYHSLLGKPVSGGFGATSKGPDSSLSKQVGHNLCSLLSPVASRPRNSSSAVPGVGRTLRKPLPSQFLGKSDSNDDSSFTALPGIHGETPRSSRRKQSLVARAGCSDIRPSDAQPCCPASKPDVRNHSQQNLEQTDAPAYSSCNKDSGIPNVNDPCSSPKKQKITPGSPLSSKSLDSSTPLCTGQKKSAVPPPKKSQELMTIVLSDSSEDERVFEKAVPPKPSPAKRKSGMKKRDSTPIGRRSTRKKPCKPAVSQTVPLRITRSVSSNKSKTPVAASGAPKRKNSSRKINPRNARSRKVNYTETQEVSSDSEAETPRYVSRSGRSSFSSGCRSCPGCKLDTDRRKEKVKLKPARKKRRPQPKSPSSDVDGVLSDDHPCLDEVRGYSEEPVEDFPQTPVFPHSPIPAVIQGLTSSDSSDEETLGTVKKARMARVVARDMDVRDCQGSPPSVEFEEDATRPKDPHPKISGICSGPAKTRSKPQTDCEGSGHTGSNSKSHSVVHERLSERSPSSPTAISQMSASSTNHVPLPYKNVIPASPESKADTDLHLDMLADASSQSPDKAPPSPAVTDACNEIDDSAGSVGSAAEVKCYLSHLDSEGRLLLDEINSESSEDDDIPNDLSLDCNSSGSSSTVENFDSQEYAESESNCSSDASSVRETTKTQHDEQVCNGGSENRNVHPPHVENELQNCPPIQLTGGDPQSREALLADPKLSTANIFKAEPEHNIDRDDCVGTQEDKVTAGIQTLQEDFAVEHGQNGGTEICSEIRDCCATEDSSLDVPDSGAAPLPQEEVSSAVHFSGMADVVDPDRLSISESQDFSQGDEARNDNSNLLPESQADSPLMRSDGGEIIIEAKACQESSLQVPLDEELALKDLDSTQNTSCNKLTDATPQLPPSSTNVTDPLNLLPHSLDESAPKLETLPQNGASEKIRKDQELELFVGSHRVIEIHVLEGCSSCKDEKSKDSSSLTDHHACRDNNENPGDSSDNRAPLEHASLPGGSPENGVADMQVETFYRAISKLMVDCLNNMVESVKLENREVVIKKANPETPRDAVKSGNQDAGLPPEEFKSVWRELNLPVSLNPRLTIEKLPFAPSEGKSCEINAVSQDLTSQDSASENSAGKCEDHKVPENACPTSNTRRSLYACRGYPTPIKRLNPTVLSVIRYNDLDIYSDEPSLNDARETDCVELVSLKGIRIQLNPEELCNVEAVLNSKISCGQDEDIRSVVPDAPAVKSRETDELVIYSDEPPLNQSPIKRFKTMPAVFENEDLGDLLIDNDAPALNEPADTGGRPEETECMIISSDDEVQVMAVPTKDAPHTEITSVTKVIPDVPCKVPVKTRKKLFKRRKSKNPVDVPSIVDLQQSQMNVRGLDPHDYTEPSSQQGLDVSEVECPSDVIGEIVIQDGGVETVRQPSWEPLPSFQTCREVLHQPQVFDSLGQPLLGLDELGDANVTAANSSLDATGENVFSASPVTINLSETFGQSPEAECWNVSDSDTLTASECSDEVTVVSPPKISTHVDRFINRHTNGCDTRRIVQSVDSDSDDDVIVVGDVPPVSNRLRNLPTPAIASSVRRGGMPSRGRNIVAVQPNRQTLGHSRPQTAMVRHVLAANGTSYYVLVTPPNSRPSNPLR